MTERAAFLWYEMDIAEYLGLAEVNIEDASSLVTE
jgi:hypothetical protein